MSNNRFTPALSKSAIKAISMMASRVSFFPDGGIIVTMPNGYGVYVTRWNSGKPDGDLAVGLLAPEPDLGPELCLQRMLGYTCNEHEVLGLCGKVAGGLI